MARSNATDEMLYSLNTLINSLYEAGWQSEYEKLVAVREVTWDDDLNYLPLTTEL